MDDTKPDWYDSYWMKSYNQVLNYLQRKNPVKATYFIKETDIFAVPPSFKELSITDLFTDTQMGEMRTLVEQIPEELLETHEFLDFGRLILHDDEYFNRLQIEICDQISKAVGEPLQPSYNFLSLYNALGICNLHLDAPSAKWTVDLCIEQSSVWPIYLSEVLPWPSQPSGTEERWQQSIMDTQHFSAHELNQGNALIFGGCCQWHFRNRIPRIKETNYCHLIFFHFIPEGSEELVDPKNWADIFDEPELSNLIIKTNSL